MSAQVANSTLNKFTNSKVIYVPKPHLMENFYKDKKPAPSADVTL